MIVKLLTDHHLEFLSLKEGCTGSSKSTLVKIPHCLKSHVTAHFSQLLKYISGSCDYHSIGDKTTYQTGESKLCL